MNRGYSAPYSTHGERQMGQQADWGNVARLRNLRAPAVVLITDSVC